MTVNELIQALDRLPAETKAQNIFLQMLGKDREFLAFIDQIYSVGQAQYYNENTGLIGQDQYEEYEDIEQNDWCLVRKDFTLIYPENTVFLLGNLPEVTEAPKAKTKAELIAETIQEGNIPHLRVERE